MKHALPITAWDRSQSNLHMHTFQTAPGKGPRQAIEVTGGCALIAVALLAGCAGEKELSK